MSCSPRSWLMLVVLSLAAAALPPAGAAQGMATLSGAVTDSVTGRPVVGALVSVLGTTRRTLTDTTGRYSFAAVGSGAVTVRAQRIGYARADRTVELRDNEQATLNFALAEVARALGEIVVTGYGTDSRRNVSAAVTTVTSEEITNVPIAGIDAALQGKAPGVQVIQNAGNPGNGITVRIRGSASVSASNQPLYVIDGIPMIRENFSQLDMAGQDLTAVTGISPDEIESATILKDAAAAAIYGSRASNGVIMITTKRGQPGRTRISFNTYGGVQEVAKKVELLNADEYAEFFYEAYINDCFIDPADPCADSMAEAEQFAAEDMGFSRNIGDTTNTNWQDAVFRRATVSDLALQMSGGSDRIQYMVSGAHFAQEGVVIGSRYNRQNIRANVDARVTDRIALRTSIGLVREDNDRNENDNTLDGVTTNAIALQPILPIRRDDGFFTSTDDGLEYTNPVALGELDAAESRTFRAIGGVEADVTLSSSFRLTGRVGADVLNLRDLRWFSPKIIGRYAASVNGIAQQGNNTATRYLTEAFATYDAPVRDAAVTITAGASVELNTSELDYLQGEGFGSETFRYPGNAGKITVYDGDKTEHNLVSLFSRANVALRDRYFLTASLRTDGSSRFGRNNRYGVFPAVSLGWMFSEESFASGLQRFGDWKLRASYGVAGNQGIGDDFAPLPRYGKANYADEPGIGPSAIGNPELKWETTREYDIGLDLFMFDGRLTLTADHYLKKTEDLLVFRPITATSGFTSFWDNIGNIENRGFELGLASVNLNPPSDDGLRWTSDLNISWNRNRVTKLFRDEPFNSGFRSVNRVEVGAPIGAYHTIIFDGVDPATGDAQYRDVCCELRPDGTMGPDGTVNADDRVIVGSPHPDYWGGLTNTFSWKGFDLRAFLSFVQGFEVYNAMRIFADDGGYYYDNKFRDVLRRWRQPGDITDVPRASWNGYSGAREVSSRYIEDGSYFRLQEVTLGYRLPVRFARQATMSEARVFISGRNLHTWTDYMGYNPDVNSFGASANVSLGTDFYAYPIARTFTFGISGAF